MEAATIAAKISRERELRWMEQNQALADKYRGQWVCIEGEHLLAASSYFSVLLAETRAKDVTVPFIVYVPERVENDLFNL